jgi:ribonuclease J
MRIGFFDGVREIGGNKILIEQNNRAVLLDFGKRFAVNNTYFNDYLVGREWKNPYDYIATGELPPFKDFYKNNVSENIDTINANIEGIFFSHAHLDHIGLIDFINDSIPKYMSAYSKEVLNFFIEKGTIGPVKNVKIFDKPIEIAGFTVKPIQTDHDIPGSFATEIDTPKGTIFYTGDIYFHGRHPEKSRALVEYARSKKPYILITEGTRFGWGAVSSPTEGELKEQVLSVLDQCRGILFGNPYEPHISRILTFFEVANERNRDFVITLPYAFILKHYANIGDENAQKILKSKKTFVYKPRRELKEWEKEFENQFVDSEIIMKEQKNIVMLLDFKSTPELLDIKPEKGAIYVHSGGEPLASIDSENTKILTNWLNLFNIPYFRIHSPGHAPQQELLWMAREINPQILLPIHTQIPERFEIVSDNVKILERGVMYDF